MTIFNTSQIRDWDKFTIANEPIASIDLMERAANACFEWFNSNEYINPEKNFIIFCGKGNNGGDGLAIARMLLSKQIPVKIYILEFGHKGTEDFQENLARLHGLTADIYFINNDDNLPVLDKEKIIIDALFGSGLNRPLEGLAAQLVNHINHSGCQIISMDIPSGLFADLSSKGNTIVKATHTLSFQVYKMAFLIAENSDYIGNIHILDIGLHPDYYNETNGDYELVDETTIKNIYKPRNQFSHKGNFGHAALVCGSTGMMGAAVLSAKACMRSGVGKLTCYIPKTGYEILQISVPEAMAAISGNEYIENYFPIAEHEAAGIGCGIGLHISHAALLKIIFTTVNKPMVIDADALTALSKNRELLKAIPKYSILTPHPKEFERLFGKSENSFERINLTAQKAKELDCIIVLKGHHSCIALPDGKIFFNNSGNAGMATAGSGDVLTGILTGLLAQGYSPADAAVLGVYLHGLAGDIAAETFSQEAMISEDISNCLGKAFKRIVL